MWQKGHLGGRYMGVGYSLHFSVYLNFSKWFLMKGRTRLVEWTSDPESQPHRKGFRTRSRLPAPWEGGVGVPQDLRAHPTLSPVEHLAKCHHFNLVSFCCPFVCGTWDVCLSMSMLAILESELWVLLEWFCLPPSYFQADLYVFTEESWDAERGTHVFSLG